MCERQDWEKSKPSADFEHGIVQGACFLPVRVRSSPSPVSASFRKHLNLLRKYVDEVGDDKVLLRQLTA